MTSSNGGKTCFKFATYFKSLFFIWECKSQNATFIFFKQFFYVVYFFRLYKNISTKIFYAA